MPDPARPGAPRGPWTPVDVYFLVPSRLEPARAGSSSLPTRHFEPALARK